MGHTALQLASSKPDFFHWPQLQLEDRFGIAVEQDKTGARLGGHHVYFRLRHMDLQNVSKKWPLVLKLGRDVLALRSTMQVMVEMHRLEALEAILLQKTVAQPGLIRKDPSQNISAKL